MENTSKADHHSPKFDPILVNEVKSSFKNLYVESGYTEEEIETHAKKWIAKMKMQDIERKLWKSMMTGDAPENTDGCQYKCWSWW